jgi:hypothetical protein
VFGFKHYRLHYGCLSQSWPIPFYGQQALLQAASGTH